MSRRVLEKGCVLIVLKTLISNKHKSYIHLNRKPYKGLLSRVSWDPKSYHFRGSTIR